MEKINVFYQREQSREVEHLQLDSGSTFAVLKALVCTKHGLDAGVLIFVEELDEASHDDHPVDAHASRGNIKVHVHRCRRIRTTVSYNGRNAEHQFAPGATVARVKKWAADKLGISPEDASELMLQIAGTKDRPSPGTHLGALAKCPECHVHFDLVPDERVNGDV